MPRPFCFKVDVDTHDGMRDGVPRLLEGFAAAGVHATFFLSFGPDNAGKAIVNVLRRKGFLKKMLKTGAPSLYGWRTILSGTLLPARLIALRFPDLVRRIRDEGHEVGVHAWDHRLWQDHLPEMDRAAVERQFARSFEAYESILGERPRAVAAPAWCATPTSLAVQDALGLDYASDMRGGPPGYPELDGYRATTLQVPSTQPCLEELLTEGRRDLAECARLVLAPPPGVHALVASVHAEVEGGVYRAFLDLLLDGVREAGHAVQRMDALAAALRASTPPPDVIAARLAPLPGRADLVLRPADEPSAAGRAGA
ncbi:MAG: polysaccharide deacetylase family protein [Planctomycetes bacterium]|nr:polysaccharide deacetylase family protein [Planctomycetota bacterium]